MLGVAFVYDPVIPGSVMGGIPPEFIESQRAEAEKTANAAIARFETTAKRVGISYESRSSAPAFPAPPSSSAAWRAASIWPIVGQPKRDNAAPAEVVDEGVLFESGRPVIFVPFIQKAGLKLDRVMVCWDGSRAATRAVADACRSWKGQAGGDRHRRQPRLSRTTKSPAPISASISPAMA